jgi:hypothetical protein
MNVRALALVLMCVLASGCSGSGRLPVRKVLVDVEAGAAASGVDRVVDRAVDRAVDREQVRAVVHDVLKRARGVQLVDGAGAVLRVHLAEYGPDVGESARADGVPRMRLALTIEVIGSPGEPTGGGYRGHAVAKGAGVDARTLVAQALRDALAQVLMTRNAADLDSAELISWLNDDNADEEQQRRATRILGSRRERAAVDGLSRVLAHGDQELQHLALAALTNIGDPSAVDAVIAYSDHKPPVLINQCIVAVRSMGSAHLPDAVGFAKATPGAAGKASPTPATRARAWLFTLSTGHADLDVQQHAAAALAALESAPAGGVAGALAEKATDGPKHEATP